MNTSSRGPDEEVECFPKRKRSKLRHADQLEQRPSHDYLHCNKNDFGMNIQCATNGSCQNLTCNCSSNNDHKPKKRRYKDQTDNSTSGESSDDDEPGHINYAYPNSHSHSKFSGKKSVPHNPSLKKKRSKQSLGINPKEVQIESSDSEMEEHSSIQNCSLPYKWKLQSASAALQQKLDNHTLRLDYLSSGIINLGGKLDTSSAKQWKYLNRVHQEVVQLGTTQSALLENQKSIQGQMSEVLSILKSHGQPLEKSKERPSSSSRESDQQNCIAEHRQRLEEPDTPSGGLSPPIDSRDNQPNQPQLRRLLVEVLTSSPPYPQTILQSSMPGNVTNMEASSGPMAEISTGSDIPASFRVSNLTELPPMVPQNFPSSAQTSAERFEGRPFYSFSDFCQPLSQASDRPSEDNSPQVANLLDQIKEDFISDEEQNPDFISPEPILLTPASGDLWENLLAIACNRIKQTRPPVNWFGHYRAPDVLDHLAFMWHGKEQIGSFRWQVVANINLNSDTEKSFSSSLFAFPQKTLDEVLGKLLQKANKLGAVRGMLWAVLRAGYKSHEGMPKWTLPNYISYSVIELLDRTVPPVRQVVNILVAELGLQQHFSEKDILAILQFWIGSAQRARATWANRNNIPH